MLAVSYENATSLVEIHDEMADTEKLRFAIKINYLIL